MRDRTIETILENLETLKKIDGPNSKLIKQYRDRIQSLIEDLHPSPYISETAAEIGWSLEFIHDSFLDPKKESWLDSMIEQSMIVCSYKQPDYDQEDTKLKLA